MAEQWIEELKRAQARVQATDEQIIEEDWPFWRSFSSDPNPTLTVGDVRGMRETREQYRNAIFGRHAEAILAALSQAPGAASSEDVERLRETLGRALNELEGLATHVNLGPIGSVSEWRYVGRDAARIALERIGVWREALAAPGGGAGGGATVGSVTNRTHCGEG